MPSLGIQSNPKPLTANQLRQQRSRRVQTVTQRKEVLTTNKIMITNPRLVEPQANYQRLIHISLMVSLLLILLTLYKQVALHQGTI